MAVEQSDLIDIISTDRVTGDVVLTISDHLDWSDSPAHQVFLQAKLNVTVRGNHLFQERSW
jgi:hypothetical protein